MRWRGALLVLAACGTPSPPPRAATPLEAPPTVAEALPAATPGAATPGAIVRAGTRRRPVEAPHGGGITLLAVSADGSAVVSRDALGGIRLWPALDGSREPRVVDLPPPVALALALGAEPRGHVIAMTDAVGALTIQIVDAEGLTVQRATLPIEPAFEGLAGVTAHGVLAWRADQRVLLVSTDGGITSDLVTGSGQRLLSIAVTGEHAIALLETGGKWRMRWLTLGAQLAWGAWIDAPDAAVGETMAISPTGNRLASLVAVANVGTFVSVVDTRSGKLLAHEPAAALAVALPSDDHVAFGSPGVISWIDLAKSKPKLPVPPTGAHAASEVRDQAILGIASGGRVVGTSAGDLVLASPKRSEFLGYELVSPAVAAAAPNGRLLIGLGATFALLDDQLVTAARPELAVPKGSAVTDVQWLTGDTWLVQSARQSGDGLHSISLVDTAQSSSTLVRGGLRLAHVLVHEPSTQLVALSLGDRPEVLRFAPRERKLGSVANLPSPKGFARTALVPVNPALANGTQLVVAQLRERLAVRWVADPSALNVGPQVTVDGSLAAVDAAGHVYLWRADPQGQLELAVFAGGKQVGTMATDGPTSIWPDPKGGQVLQVSGRSVSLVGKGDVRKWAVPLEGVTDVHWLDDGAIAIVSSGGIARLDAATGNVIATRCGWRFGLSAGPHPPAPRIEPICSQLR